MMKLQTPVECTHSRIGLSYNDRILVLGSCFADNIGQKMVQAGFCVMVNPFGTLYNPVSVNNALLRLESGEHFTEDDCIKMGAGADLYCSFCHHTSFARVTKEEFLANANTVLDQACNFYQNCNKVIVTLGTSFCYVYNGNVVSNCLKRPQSEFTRVFCDSSKTEEILNSILSRGAGKDFIFTVSPIRHMADGAAANQYSKSSLIVAVNNLCNKSGAEYFPAYEIVMDELRDYRFYAEDMLHPTAQTVNYLWERFADFALSGEEKEKLLVKEKLFRQSQHRQMHPDHSADTLQKNLR